MHHVANISWNEAPRSSDAGTRYVRFRTKKISNAPPKMTKANPATLLGLSQ